MFIDDLSLASRNSGFPAFPSPWLDSSTLATPRSFRNALDWAEYIFNVHGTYRMAMERLIAYFITDVEISTYDTRSSLGDEEKQKWEHLLHTVLDIVGATTSMCRNLLCYGNSFATVVIPFRRMLVCRTPGCGSIWAFREIAERPGFKYIPHKQEFVINCPRCKKSGPAEIRDWPDNLGKKLRLKTNWPPQQIELLYDLVSEETQYLWRLPEEYKRKIRMGDLLTLENAPMAMLEAAATTGLYRFHPDMIFHMKEPTLAGSLNRGWGIPRSLTTFRDIVHVQTLRSYNESLAKDHIIPFRVLTPMPRPGISGSGGALGVTVDPLVTSDMGQFVPQVLSMIHKRRRDPTRWNVLPFPIQYTAIGGDARAFAPVEMLDQAWDTLLNATGVPADLYRGTLQLQATPISLRLFEATFQHLVRANNMFVRWVAKKIAELLSWETVNVRWSRITHADDFQKQMTILQLVMSGDVSKSRGLKMLGLDWREEQRTIADEARYQATLQAKVQEEMEQAAFGQEIARGQLSPQQTAGGAPPAGDASGAGAPGGGALPPQSLLDLSFGGTPQSPDEMLAQAEQIAQYLAQLPESQRRSEMYTLRHKNPTLYAVVKDRREQMINQARTAGGAMLLGQQPNTPQM